MAYIGAEPVPGQNREVDDISSGFNGSATQFTLQVNSLNTSPVAVNSNISSPPSGTLADKYWLGETFEEAYEEYLKR